MSIGCALHGVRELRKARCATGKHLTVTAVEVAATNAAGSEKSHSTQAQQSQRHSRTLCPGIFLDARASRSPYAPDDGNGAPADDFA